MNPKPKNNSGFSGTTSYKRCSQPHPRQVRPLGPMYFLLPLLSFAVRNQSIFFSLRFADTFSECFGERKGRFC